MSDGCTCMLFSTHEDMWTVRWFTEHVCVFAAGAAGGEEAAGGGGEEEEAAVSRTSCGSAGGVSAAEVKAPEHIKGHV